MRSRTYRLAVLGALVSLCAAVLPAGPAGAATKNSCKLLKSSQISQVFDQPVGKPEKGLTTAVSTSCTWGLDVTETKTDGTVSTFQQRVGAKIAFDVNREDLDGTEDISGLGGKAFWQPTGESGGVVWVLKGEVLLTVQGVFIAIGDSPPVDLDELQDELVALAKIARKKV